MSFLTSHDMALRAFDKDLEQDARRQAVDSIKVAVRDSGILKDAEERERYGSQ
jgi:hypothetical protein